jgi:hypothetical protein
MYIVVCIIFSGHKSELKQSTDSMDKFFPTVKLSDIHYSENSFGYWCFYDVNTIFGISL